MGSAIKPAPNAGWNVGRFKRLMGWGVEGLQSCGSDLMLTRRERIVRRVLCALVILLLLGSLVSAFAQPQIRAWCWYEGGNGRSDLTIRLKDGSLLISSRSGRVHDAGGASGFGLDYRNLNEPASILSWVLPVRDRDALGIPMLVIACVLCLAGRYAGRWLPKATTHDFCPSCGYSLDGLTIDTCPECGQTTDAGSS